MGSTSNLIIGTGFCLIVFGMGLLLGGHLTEQELADGELHCEWNSNGLGVTCWNPKSQESYNRKHQGS